jgi:hypothetical protein
MIKPDKDQRAINAARKKGKTIRPKKKEAVPETLQKKEKGQTTLDAMMKGRKK